MTVGQFAEPKLLIPRLLSDQQPRAIEELTLCLETADRIQDAPAFLEAVLNRELDMPTFIEGVALPHARSAAVNRLSVAVGLCPAGIAWGRDRRRIAKVVFLFAVPLTEAGGYMSLLSGISRFIRDPAAFAAFQRATEPEEMLTMLNAVQLRRWGTPSSQTEPGTKVINENEPAPPTPE
jgi:mannitol/fructose-specific phosphotransferase system IIA component (Ntr-type)